ncbi:hypothetical protein TNCV_858281 [Trichonephila clavipes]|nr:hypothetical protein TNCV_858281 [Trichonephila clavipes]
MRICQSKYYDEESVKYLLEGILEERDQEFEERRLAREFELERLRGQLRNKLNENKLKAGNRINNLANVCYLSGNRTTEVSEPVNKCRPLINPVVNLAWRMPRLVILKMRIVTPSEMDERFPPV